MSFTENDRKFRSRIGKSFHDGGGYDGPPFGETIAAALKAEFGSAPSAVKRVARLAAANERTARNWIEGRNGPSGDHLVRLMRHSDAVFDLVLSLSRRDRVVVGAMLMNLREHLVAVTAAIDSMDP